MKHISQRDIARELGINVSTVSRALRGLDGVSDEHPRLSFVKQNQREIGIKAFRLLLDQMNGDESVQHVIVKAILEIRDSTRK